MKPMLFLLLAGFLACSQTVPTAKNEPIVVTTCDTTVTVRANGSFKIKLPAVISTGFSWGVVAQTDPSVLLPPTNDLVTEPSTDDRDGRKEVQILALTAANKKGTTVLTLHYRRAFEKNEAPEKTCTITVVVK